MLATDNACGLKRKRWFLVVDLPVVRYLVQSSCDEGMFELGKVERFGPCGVMLKQYGNDAKAS